MPIQRNLRQGTHINQRVSAESNIVENQSQAGLGTASLAPVLAASATPDPEMPDPETPAFATLDPEELAAADDDPQPSSQPAVPSPGGPDKALPTGTSEGSAAATNPYFARPHYSRLNLHVLRHASAGTRRANLKIDVKRPLDKEGKRHCLQLAHVLNGLKLSFDLIISSPLKRCLQTAQLIGTETGYEAKILQAKALEPGATYAQFQRLVHECRAYDNVLMVGHNPTVTLFLGQLIGHLNPEDEVAGAARIRMRKGTLARVSLDRGPALLQWVLDPRIVRALYDTSTKSSRRKVSRK